MSLEITYQIASWLEFPHILMQTAKCFLLHYLLGLSISLISTFCMEKNKNELTTLPLEDIRMKPISLFSRYMCLNKGIWYYFIPFESRML